MKSKKWIYVKKFDGPAKLEDFKLIEKELLQVGENEILLESVYFSVDPYMKPFQAMLNVGDTCIGEQIAKVTESRHPSYEVNELLLINLGWQDKIIINPDNCRNKIKKIWGTGNLPSSYSLGIIGMPGFSAYFGLLELLSPKPGEIIYINSAAGIVGAIAGQIAKIIGCKVIGSAGTEEKLRYIKGEYGFDEVFNYKTTDVTKQLKNLAPNGIDCFFDNVGGLLSCEIIKNNLKKGGKIVCCGNLSGYNEIQEQNGPLLFFTFIIKQLTMKGLIVYEFENRYQEAAEQLLSWTEQGKIKIKEEIIEGFENLPQTLIDLLAGKFSGKIIVKV